MSHLNGLAGCALLSLLLLVGCNTDNKSANNLKPAALVNGQVIAADQIQSETAKLGQGTDGQGQAMANLALKNIVDQELLAQEAVKAKLNEKPEVQWKLDAARRQILAQSEIETMTRDVVAPAQAEIKAYYDGHPELFSQHKIYQLAYLVANTTPENIAKARELVQKGGTVQALAAAIQALGITVGGQRVVKGAEELPKDALDRFSAMKAGQSLTMDQGGKLNIIVLEGVQERPIAFEPATQTIGAYLINDKKRQQIDGQLSKIRTSARIEYRAPYAAPDAAKVK
ncbi:MAG: peptidyl-prolyl cis-trans isomerase, EpsD family [Hydrogenophilales bacterium CG03_land_8_20_14_0_80_62_28]|nr:peptidyl-prolyl cis-trans isomerase, EpsD family [Betaproteobacteria bacterium]OIO78487.1 MAG: peptidyl-prolyl cis-trans isomerase, EpsD family [Hydrogenophilaceae bacterium CG1_02_62_390]PIV22830.1 MAG: peptidyl-prolyl cis-trans isomerase, EpsD family [Hydrogenophilales bacterium CG03_land_8_20_14_0_80_62_28]PIW37911.1 MAG: peptidyl-prolyl cis-trans isomerase, EpsD family [Hydrogenophilales bacterium CG15_BIG_FIL_POST_REV_8_21_14_020_62_31]PIW71487.1 MAG: peptidyl-prolyl cis-trans isomerase